jgi:hypothetical protein
MTRDEARRHRHQHLQATGAAEAVQLIALAAVVPLTLKCQSRA